MRIGEYIEQFCREHPGVGHTDTECHYADLNSDRHQTAQAEQLRYPAVMFETAGYVASVAGDTIQKRHQCHLQVVTHVKDTGDYGEIEKALDTCDGILTDFMVGTVRQRRARQPRMAARISFDGMEVIPIENKGDALYGVLARFYVQESVCNQQ